MSAVGDTDLDRRRIRQRHGIRHLRPDGERTGQDRHAEPGPDQAEDGEDVAGFGDDRGRETRLRARPKNEIVERRPPSGEMRTKGVRPEIGEADVAGARKRMDRPAALRPEPRSSMALGRDVAMRDGKDGKGDVDPPVHERVDLLPGVQSLEVEHHVRVTGEKRLEDLCPGRRPRRRGRIRSKGVRPPVSRTCEPWRRRGRCPAEYAAIFSRKASARLRQRDKMSRPVKEIDAELALEVLDLLGEGGLRNVEFLGSSAEVKLVGDRNEVTQVPKFQNSLLLPLFLSLSEDSSADCPRRCRGGAAAG